ncbi:MAG: hypothetical protein PVI23_14600 [Maricaulaceae bacterium]|jgi:hypothetical protein
MRKLYQLIAFSLLTVGCATGSEDTAGHTADIAGVWVFQSEPYNLNCIMAGQLQLAPTGAPDDFEGVLLTVERCPAGSVNARELATEQEVRAQRSGNRLRIDSTIVQVSPANTVYFEDNFRLRIIDGSLMQGYQLGPTGFGVEFWRPEE